MIFINSRISKGMIVRPIEGELNYTCNFGLFCLKFIVHLTNRKETFFPFFFFFFYATFSRQLTRHYHSSPLEFLFPSILFLFDSLVPFFPRSKEYESKNNWRIIAIATIILFNLFS